MSAASPNDGPASPPVAAAEPHHSFVERFPWLRRHVWGFLSVLLALVGAGAVACLYYPQLLTMERLRDLYPVAVIRVLIYVVLFAAIALGAIGVFFSSQPRRGLLGMLIASGALALGGGSVPVGEHPDTRIYFGLDWLVLNVIFYSIVFVPLERWFPLRAYESFVKPEWWNNLAYFVVNSIFIQAITYLATGPAHLVERWVHLPPWANAVSLPVQFLLIVVVADLLQYWTHRAYHEVPFLWRLHRVHHSVRRLDWLAGSRLHLGEILATRGTIFAGIYLMGFDERAFGAYLAFVALHATFIHSNLRWRFPAVERWFVTARYHHFHHSSEDEAIDRNYAVHLPVLDRLFGTFFLPADGRWPKSYGLAGGETVPGGYVGQFFSAFRK